MNAMESHSNAQLIEGALALGFTLSEAVQRALGRSLSEFAEAHGHRQSEVSMCLGGYPGRIYAQVRDDLCAELSIERATLDRWIAERTASAAA